MNSRLARAYAKVPYLACKGLCHASCGIIPLLGKERELAERISHEHVDQIPILATVTIYDEKRECCPFLHPSGRCSIYDERPLMCRVWGVAEGLTCPHGCEPEERMNKKRFKNLVEEVKRA